MKKILLLLGIAVFSHALTLDESSLKVEFEGYKTPDFIATKGAFSNVKYTFNKDTSSLSSTLKNAKAVLNPNDLLMDTDEITNNIKNVFFKALNKGKSFEVAVINVAEGKDKGVISTIVKIGNEKANLALTYTIQNDDFNATGELDLSSFKNSSKALSELSKVAAGHAGISYPLVKIILSGKVK